MDSEGRLTKTGLFYEGNYHEWEGRLWDMLKLLGADIDAPFGKLSNGTPIITFIGSLVIPRLLLTMPESAKMGSRPQWHKHLLPGLKLAAEPFRTMELPVDVRARIWTFAIASQQGLKSYSITADSHFSNELIHPLTRASREVRAETLALAWLDVKVEYKPSVNTLGPRYGSKYAKRFYQLEAFEQSNKVSRVLPVYASFPIFEKTAKRQRQTAAFLMLTISPS